MPEQRGHSVEGHTGPATELAEEGDEGERCAICFEHRPFVSRPCPCRANYCAGCWDHALAASVTARGRAQCPSCRTTLRVDYDARAGGPIFLLESGGGSADAWQAALCQKMRPAQVHLLNLYGMAVAGSVQPSQASAAARVAAAGEAGAAGAPAPVTGAATAAASAPPPAEPPTAAAPAPLCVCGAPLERISAVGRMERLLDEKAPGWSARVPDASSLLEHLASTPLVTCDLCGAIEKGCVWTCKRGAHTVLHPGGYDICEGCFGRHSCLAACTVAPPAGAGGGRGAGPGPRRLQGCWQPGTLAVCGALPWSLRGLGLGSRLGHLAAALR